MSTPGTIILTREMPAVAADLAERLPGMQVVTAARALPPARPGGPAWCFVDWLLPELSGLEMCRRLRDAPGMADSHITLILDEDDAESRRRALRAGADDYLLAPLTGEMVAERVLRSPAPTGGRNPDRLAHGELSVDLAARQARWRGQPVPLRPNELRLLAHFVEHPDQVFSRGALIGVLGKDSEVRDERTVDVWVGRLRRGLGTQGVPDPLRTVRSLGYVLDSASG